MPKKSLEDWNKIIKTESDITPEFEKDYPYFAEAYKNGFKLKKILRILAYPFYAIFLYLSSLGTVFFVLISIMLFFPLIFTLGDFGFLYVGKMFLFFEIIFGRSFDFKMLMSIIFIISFIYSLLNEFVKYFLEKRYRLNFKLKVYTEILYFLGIYAGLTIISCVIALFLDNWQNVLGYYILVFITGIFILGYKLVMLMIAKYFKSIIQSNNIKKN